MRNEMANVASDEIFPFGEMTSQSGQKIALKSVAVDGDVQGLLFSCNIRQFYRNDTNKKLEVIYTFPLGWDTSLMGMDASIGGKRLHGEVVEKAAAELTYEETVEKGDSAIMVQKSSDGLYTANLGNIKPGEDVEVDLQCARLLNFEQGRVRLCIPSVIGERYGDPHADGGLAPHESVRADKNANYPLGIKLRLHGEAASRLVSSPSHKIELRPMQGGMEIELDKACMDRDFILLLEGMKGDSHAMTVPCDEGWMTMASFCPRMENVDISPVALKILVDCSGSMCGESIGQARKGLKRILHALQPADAISCTCFGSNVRHLYPAMQPCTEEVLKGFTNLIDKIDADMGGTEMNEALKSTINDIAVNGDGAPALLMITDGDVWDVKNIVSTAKNSGHRVFVIGVGYAPSDSLLHQLAEQTGGACEFVTPNEDVAGAIVRMFHRMRGAGASHVTVDWKMPVVWQSGMPKFIYDSETARAFALTREKPETGPTLHWQAKSKKYSESIEHVEECQAGDLRDDLSRLGRMRQMEESKSVEEKLALSLKYGLLDDLTSFILVYERPEGEKADGLPSIQHVPQMRAHGHGNYMCMKSFCASAFFGGSSFFADFGMQNFDTCLMAHPDILRDGHDNGDTVVDMENMLINEMGVQKVVKLWQKYIHEGNSLKDFMELAARENGLEPICKYLSAVATEMKLDAGYVWAAFLMWTYGDKQPERHALRLIKSGGVTPEMQASLNAKFDNLVIGA